jgi:NADPH:quinone reductase-like Zn-dependent oxidoreductase
MFKVIFTNFNTMKAIILIGFGGIENLASTELPIPDISENEVLVKIKAFSINPVDIKTRMGRGLAPVLKGEKPMILGWDISGSVIKTGKSVTLFNKGDEVFGMVNFPGHGKAYAEYVAAPASHLALKPPAVSHEECAAASLAALTAWQILKEKVRIKPGDRVLIHSAAGGVGHYAVQMAKHLGASVIGTSSAENRAFVLNLGASEHINYKEQLFENIAKDVDLVLDTIGGEYIDRSLKVLKPGGTIISIPSGASEAVKEKAGAAGAIGDTFRVRSDGRNMAEIAGMLEKKIIRSHISKIFAFGDIRAAHQHIETGKTKGKIVVSIP